MSMWKSNCYNNTSTVGNDNLAQFIIQFSFYLSIPLSLQLAVQNDQHYGPALNPQHTTFLYQPKSVAYTNVVRLLHVSKKQLWRQMNIKKKYYKWQHEKVINNHSWQQIKNKHAEHLVDSPSHYIITLLFSIE